MGKTETLTGTCHCGTVTWNYNSTPNSATACNCTVCSKAGVLWIYGIVGESVRISGETIAYLRDDTYGGDLEFHHRPTCGNAICWKLAKPNEAGKIEVAVNIRLADDPKAVMDLPIRHFDGLTTFKSLPGDGKTVRDMWF